MLNCFTCSFSFVASAIPKHSASPRRWRRLGSIDWVISWIQASKSLSKLKQGTFGSSFICKRVGGKLVFRTAAFYCRLFSWPCQLLLSHIKARLIISTSQKDIIAVNLIRSRELGHLNLCRGSLHLRPCCREEVAWLGCKSDTAIEVLSG